MLIGETAIAGAFIVEPEKQTDERGFFARVFSEDVFAAHGLETRFVQSSVSFNPRRGTLRGMHYQAEPHGEIKLVRCTRGEVYDVIVDLRPNSSSFRCWHAAKLSAENRLTLYIPRGVAHGFLTLAPNTEIFYQISTGYRPEAARGLRWDDPAIGIDWPGKVELISDHDAQFQLLDPRKASP